MDYRCFLSALLMCLLPVAGGWAQSEQDPFKAGKAAFEAGRFEAAVGHFQQVEEQDPRYEEARYYLARTFLHPDHLDSKRAGKLISWLRKRDPENIRYLELDLWRKYFHSSSFLPIIQDLKRIELADKILKRDPDNPVAHFVLGARASEALRQQYHAVQFEGLNMLRASLSQEADLRTAAAYLLEPYLEDHGSGPQVTFYDEHFTGREMPATSMRKAALSAFEEARRHLGKALKGDPNWREAYTLLARNYAIRGAYPEAFGILDSMRTFLPQDPDTWLYRGYFAYRAGELEEARAGFEQGLALLNSQERRVFEDIAYFLPEVQQVWYAADSAGYAHGYWQSRDPRLLTEVNERLLEHYARLVYADLRFGENREGHPGWETEPGQTIVRYGEPAGEARYSTRADVYLILHYDSLYFKFIDLAKAGYYTFYSPSARAFQGFRPARGVIENDFAVKGPGTFRKTPDLFAYDLPGRVRMPFQVSAMRGEGGQTDLYVAYGIPLDGVEPETFAVETGAFLLQSSKGLIAEHRTQLQGRTVETHVSPEATEHWSGVHTLTAPPGGYTLSVEFAPTEGTTPLAYERTPVHLPDFKGDRLMLSDVVLASTVEEASGEVVPDGWLARGDVMMMPAFSGTYRVDQPIYFYYEVYGLEPGVDGRSRYALEAVLVRREEAGGLEKLIKKAFGGGGETGVSIQFEGSSPGRDDGQYLVMDAASVEPGPYVLVLRLTDLVTQKTVERRRNLQLRPMIEREQSE